MSDRGRSSCQEKRFRWPEQNNENRKLQASTSSLTSSDPKRTRFNDDDERPGRSFSYPFQERHLTLYDIFGLQKAMEDHHDQRREDEKKAECARIGNQSFIQQLQPTYGSLSQALADLEEIASFGSDSEESPSSPDPPLTDETMQCDSTEAASKTIPVEGPVSESSPGEEMEDVDVQYRDADASNRLQDDQPDHELRFQDQPGSLSRYQEDSPNYDQPGSSSRPSNRFQDDRPGQSSRSEDQPGPSSRYQEGSPNYDQPGSSSRPSNRFQDDRPGPSSRSENQPGPSSRYQEDSPNCGQPGSSSRPSNRFQDDRPGPSSRSEDQPVTSSGYQEEQFDYHQPGPSTCPLARSHSIAQTREELIAHATQESLKDVRPKRPLTSFQGGAPTSGQQEHSDYIQCQLQPQKSIGDQREPESRFAEHMDVFRPSRFTRHEPIASGHRKRHKKLRKGLDAVGDYLDQALELFNRTERPRRPLPDSPISRSPPRLEGSAIERYRQPHKYEQPISRGLLCLIRPDLVKDEAEAAKTAEEASAEASDAPKAEDAQDMTAVQVGSQRIDLEAPHITEPTSLDVDEAIQQAMEASTSQFTQALQEIGPEVLNVSNPTHPKNTTLQQLETASKDVKQAASGNIDSDATLPMVLSACENVELLTFDDTTMDTSKAMQINLESLRVLETSTSEDSQSCTSKTTNLEAAAGPSQSCDESSQQKNTNAIPTSTSEDAQPSISKIIDPEAAGPSQLEPLQQEKPKAISTTTSNDAKSLPSLNIDLRAGLSQRDEPLQQGSPKAIPTSTSQDAHPSTSMTIELGAGLSQPRDEPLQQEKPERPKFSARFFHPTCSTVLKSLREQPEREGALQVKLDAVLKTVDYHKKLDDMCQAVCAEAFTEDFGAMPSLRELCRFSKPRILKELNDDVLSKMLEVAAQDMREIAQEHMDTRVEELIVECKIEDERERQQQMDQEAPLLEHVDPKDLKALLDQLAPLQENVEIENGDFEAQIGQEVAEVADIRTRNLCSNLQNR